MKKLVLTKLGKAKTVNVEELISKTAKEFVENEVIMNALPIVQMCFNIQYHLSPKEQESLIITDEMILEAIDETEIEEEEKENIEIMEYWFVNRFLAKDLKELGEIVIDTEAGYI